MVLGIDIGGTNTKFGIIDENYRVQQKYSITTENKFDDTYFIKTIIERVKEIRKEVDYDRICVGSLRILVR